MRVLFVQHDHVSPPGPVGEAFSDRGFDVEDLLVVPEQRFSTPDVEVVWPDPLAYDAIVPMGAPWSVYDVERIGSWVVPEVDFLRRAVAADVPVFGICFGGQALAAALGGRVLPADTHEIGWTAVDSDRPALVPAGPWFQWHADRWELPEGLAPFARTAVAEQAFVAGRSLGMQFHPELTPTMLDGWLDNGGEAHARSLGLDPQALRDETHTRSADAEGRARSLVHAFLDQVALAAEPRSA